MTIDCSAALPTQLQYLTRARACPQQPTALALSAIQGSKGNNCLTFSHYTFLLFEVSLWSCFTLCLAKHQAAAPSCNAVSPDPEEMSVTAFRASFLLANGINRGSRLSWCGTQPSASAQHATQSNTACCEFRHIESRPETRALPGLPARPERPWGIPKDPKASTPTGFALRGSQPRTRSRLRRWAKRPRFRPSRRRRLCKPWRSPTLRPRISTSSALNPSAQSLRLSCENTYQPHEPAAKRRRRLCKPWRSPTLRPQTAALSAPHSINRLTSIYTI